jgi:hypothetical protein
LLVLAFYFFLNILALLHREAMGYRGYCCSSVVDFSQNYTISWMWSVLWLAIRSCSMLELPEVGSGFLRCSLLFALVHNMLAEDCSVRCCSPMFAVDRRRPIFYQKRLLYFQIHCQSKQPVLYLPKLWANFKSFTGDLENLTILEALLRFRRSKSTLFSKREIAL